MKRTISLGSVQGVSAACRIAGASRRSDLGTEANKGNEEFGGASSAPLRPTLHRASLTLSKPRGSHYHRIKRAKQEWPILGASSRTNRSNTRAGSRTWKSQHCGSRSPRRPTSSSGRPTSSNVLNTLKMVPEVCRIFCATANPTEVVVAETEQGRGILGVVDGSSPKGVETEDDIAWRKGFLRQIGYKL